MVDLSTRMPPQNVEAERGVLGAVLYDQSAMDDVAPILVEGHFFRDTHQTIYRSIRELYDAGRPFDVISLAEELSRRGEYEAIGGDDALTELMDSVPHSASARHHAQIVHGKFQMRLLIEASNENIKECYDMMDSADSIMDRAETRVCAVRGGVHSTSADVDMKTVGVEAMARVERRWLGERSGVLTGFRDLDYLVGGLNPQQLIVLAARTSVGKSSLAVAVARNATMKFGVPTLYITLEMDRNEVYERLISLESGVDATSLKRSYPPDDRSRAAIVAAAGRLAGCPHFRLDDTPSVSVSSIHAAARRMASQVGLGLIVVDYLQLIESGHESGKSAGRQEQVSAISRRLKLLARDVKVPVLALSQLNRQPEMREDRKPRLADLRESGAIENDADVVILMHRPEFYNPDDRPGEADLMVVKNRNGDTGTIGVVFDRRCVTFREMASDEFVPDGPAF